MSGKNKLEKKIARPEHYDMIRIPVITEKTTQAASLGKYVFNVAPDVNKIQVKEAVEAVFGVNVAKVNILVLKGKTKIFRGRPGKREDRKRAIVTLKEGQTLDVSANV